MRRLGCHAGTVYDGRIGMSRWCRQRMVVRLLLFVRFARCHVIYGRKTHVEGTGARTSSSHGSRKHHLQTPSSSSIPKTYIVAIHRTISAYRTAHAACTSDFPSISIPAVSGPSLLHDCAAICGDWRLDDAHRAGSCYVYRGTRTTIIHA